MRRQKVTNNFNFKILKIFFYYFFVIRTILQIKRKLNVTHILISGRMQNFYYFLCILFQHQKFFLLRTVWVSMFHMLDLKKKYFFFLYFKSLKKNNYRIYILQLANSRENYFRILDQKFLNDEIMLIM